MNKQDRDMLNRFFKDTRYYERPLLNGHYYGVRTPNGTFLSAFDTEELFERYEAAITKEQKETP